MTDDPPSFLDATPEQVRHGVALELIKLGFTDGDEKTIAGAVMVPVEPVIEAKDAEIARLRAQMESVRTDERVRLAVRFRKLGMLAAANECDPLGPLQGARAIGGTE